MTRERLIGIAVGAATVIITLLLLYALEGRSAQNPVPPLEPSAYDRKLLRLDRQGVEAAYRARVALLFQNWMTDTNEESQNRALRGHRNARNIYIKVMTGIDERDPEGAEEHK